MLTLQFSGNATTGQVKEITHGGKRYLVSPVVALREGILNDTYVSAAEFSKFAASWQGRPVPIAHPKNEGGYTSANTPDIWATDVLGHLWNVEVNNGALKGEIWIDLDKAQLMGTRATAIVNRLRAGQPLEVSTGYFCEMEVTPGTWAGKSYSAIAHNIRPDHLALLPDEAGACSWADGCGTPRVNNARRKLTSAASGGDDSQGESMDEQSLFNRFLGWLKNDQSQNISPISNAEGTVSAPSCSCESTEGQIVSEPILPIEETPSMNKSELIGALAANAKCKFSQEKLATWEEADLQVLQESLAAPEPAAVPPVPDAASATPPAAQDVDLMAQLAELRSMIKGLTANSDREKAELVAAIVTNSRGAWSEADLMGRDLPKLQQVYASYLPRDYSANAGALRPAFGPEEEELLMRWPMFEKKEG